MSDTKVKSQVPTLVKVITWVVGLTFVILGIALFFRMVIVPNYRQAETEKRAKRQQQAVVKNQSSVGQRHQPTDLEITLNPGKGRVIPTNHKNVVWKTEEGSVIMIRELGHDKHGRPWAGDWKKDVSGRGTPFDCGRAEAMEIWVPSNYRSATITITIS